MAITLSNSVCQRLEPTWSPQEDKLLEMLVFMYPQTHPRRWDAIAAHFSDKMAPDVRLRCEWLVAELTRISKGPGVAAPPEWDLMDSEAPSRAAGETGASSSSSSPPAADGKRARKRTGKTKSGDDRKKPEKWSHQEHSDFLLGLRKIGKGNWKGISKEFVKTRNASQIASHYQKFHMRQRKNECNESKRRSIHDITDPNMVSPATAAK